MTATGPQNSRFRFETRIAALALAAGLPAVAIALYYIWTAELSPQLRVTLTLVVVGFWVGFASTVRERVEKPLRTTSNLLAALREGDFSVRAHGSKRGDSLNRVFSEVSALGETLHEQRLGALEATALLRTVMAEIDVAVFTFDDDRRLRLVNRAGERLLDRPAEHLLGRTSQELGLAPCLAAAGAEEPLAMSFPGGSGRWGVRVSSFREHGRRHQLLVMTDLTRPLRAEEVAAWKRLVRVIGHELNNSLAPIKSIANSLQTTFARRPRPADYEQDVAEGLAAIATRADSLSRFMTAYASLAKLPPPALGPVEVAKWIRRVAGLEQRVEVGVQPGPDVTIQGDGDQLDQLLINLVRNAADAVSETGGAVTAGWRISDGHVEIHVTDEGPGLANTTNLFVPFFTTKPGGTGIGLALSRQIAENHHGDLTLENRANGPGCEAVLRLPIT